MAAPTVDDRVAGALYAMMAGDALAVPLHWYYTKATRDEHRAKYYNDTLDRFYQIDPEIRENHPDSGNFFKAVSQLFVANNDVDAKPGAVEDLISKEHRPLWDVANIHYHASLDKGENTTSTELAKLLCQSIVDTNGEYSAEHYVDLYIDFFKNHKFKDLYLEGIHKYFFTQLKEGTPKLECGLDDETCLSGITFILPLALLYHNDREKLHELVQRQISITHRSDDMYDMAFAIADLISDLLNGKEPKAAIQEAYGKFTTKQPLDACLEAKSDAELYANEVFPIAWYGAVPGILYFAYKYLARPFDGLVGNADIGGDSIHRGSVLGAILGAANGTAWIPEHIKTGFVDANRSDDELHGLIKKFAAIVANKSKM